MRRLLLGFIALALAACGRNDGQAAGPQYAAKPPEQSRAYVLAVYPLHTPVRVFELYGPLIDYLNRRMPGVAFRLEASRSYEEFERKLYGRQFDFALPNPYQTLRSLDHGYHVVAKMGDDEKLTGLILVRRDSGIQRIADLKGKKVCYPARSALAGTLMPQYYLQTHDLDVGRDIENLYVGSHESSIMNVYLGNVAAGTTRPQAWDIFRKEHPEMARQLDVKWETPPLVNNGLVVRDDVPPRVAQDVARLLVNLNADAEGKRILAPMMLSRFELADDQRYRVVEDFLHDFNRKVRPLDEVKP